MYTENYFLEWLNLKERLQVYLKDCGINNALTSESVTVVRKQDEHEQNNLQFKEIRHDERQKTEVRLLSRSSGDKEETSVEALWCTFHDD